MPVVNVGFGFDLQADIVLEDGTKHRVGPFGPRELVAFERQFKIPATFLGEMPRMEWVAYLAYTQLARRKIVSGTFDEFLDRLDDMRGEMTTPEESEEGEEPGPPPEDSPSGSP